MDENQIIKVAQQAALLVHYAMNWDEPMNGDDIEIFCEILKTELQELNGDMAYPTKD